MPASGGWPNSRWGGPRGLPPDVAGGKAQKVQAAWSEAGREGQARIVALAYFGLGDTLEESRRYLLHYYEPMGTEMAEMIAGSALRSPEAITGAIEAFAQAEVDELILDPTVANPGQVDLLAESCSDRTSPPSTSR